MINLIDTIHSQIKDWDEDRKCGFCWEFGAPLKDSMLNRTERDSDDCKCVQVYVTNLRIEEAPQYNLNVSSYRTKFNYIYNFDINFLMFDEIGSNVYSEIPNHPISESTWAEILNPLIECKPEIDFCEIVETVVQQKAVWTPIIREFDNNLSGWRVNISLTQKVF